MDKELLDAAKDSKADHPMTFVEHTSLGQEFKDHIKE